MNKNKLQQEIADLAKVELERRKNNSFYQTISNRKYQQLNGYVSHNETCLELSEMSLSLDLVPPEDSFNVWIEKNIFEASKESLQFYWLEEKLISAFSNTEVPKEFHNFQRPIKSGLFYLPPILKDDNNSYIEYILFWHKKKCENLYYHPIYNDDDIRKMAFSLLFNLDIKDSDMIFCMSFSATSYRTYARAIDKGIISPTEHVEKMIGKSIFSDETIQMLDEKIQVIDLLIQVLLYLQAKPERANELLYYSTNPKRIGFGKNAKLNPIIIGKDYQIKRAKSQYRNTDSHRKIAASFWRRGHYRYQPIGTRVNPDYKLIWIEPTLING
jgi:hypothetical protein